MAGHSHRVPEANSTTRSQMDVRFGRILSFYGVDGFAHVRVCPMGRGCAQRAAAPQNLSGVDVNKKSLKTK